MCKDLDGIHILIIKKKNTDHFTTLNLDEDTLSLSMNHMLLDLHELFYETFVTFVMDYARN